MIFKNFFVSMQLARSNLTARPLGEASYEVFVGAEKRNLTHSSFNPAWLKEMGKTPTTILELGSYDGGDGFRFRQCFPEARIISVEADPDRFRIVRDNLKNQRISAMNFAVCDVDGEIDWFSATIEGKARGQGSLFRHSDRYKRRFSFVSQSSEPVKLAAKRLDTLCREQGIDYVDLLHMDIEGAEQLALLGLGEIRPDVIYLEMRDSFFVGAGSKKETHALLRQLGYVLVVNFWADRMYRHSR
jgi:FkbM family methyltransferase